jgi:ATP/maltotriose-dependent transcriptional regulator MalT
LSPPRHFEVHENNVGLETSGSSSTASSIWVTEQTVKFHFSSIYRKLDVANRTEAGRWATLNGLLADDELPVG